MSDKSLKAGVIFAVAAYAMWGFAPLYFKMLMVMPAAEILVHRVIWSALLLVVLVLALKQLPKVQAALKNPRVIKILLISGLLLAGNWLLFIWAVNNGHLLDASLGYYVNPLLNVFLGRMFLGERLRRMQKIAVAIALFGVLILLFSYGELPWIALLLASSFGVYGLLRKQVAVDSLPGLLIETMMMLPFAIFYWLFFASQMSNLFSNDADLNALLIGAGIITTAPLLCFTAAARRIRYSTLGFFQYIGPSIMFILAVYLYDEPLHEARLVTFGFVWLALVIFSFDSYRAYRKSLKCMGV
ncbi:MULTISPECIES: EamA family transporter RarD [Aliiglaciecola]|uniref:EamA family transporter RarD n=1 Tax=Aliiglaciecola TaxID=1406885 RepID=UPI001C0A5D0F|nr:MULTISPECIES: EamA family transporter RarD [Aliiglaciecola]MBU2880256.1 EamA family transporter RarD [Aliiglaciecola lipolytica]MDO6712680.1 EamA family transporter RarD [Aliiglaciecola sp. 2_MG-2023]MDO6752935.1 EamA family transporter RarD [Aliiglaciecola sp. 1_MG-2023]